MTRQEAIELEQELRMLSEQLTPEELYIIQYLKSFNRENMRDWQERELGIFGEKVFKYS